MSSRQTIYASRRYAATSADLSQMKITQGEKQRQSYHPSRDQQQQDVGEEQSTRPVLPIKSATKDSLFSRFKASSANATAEKKAIADLPRRNIYQLQEARQSVGNLLVGAASEMLKMRSIRKGVRSLFRGRSESAAGEIESSSLHISQP